MTPELSRRIARIMNTTTLLELSLVERKSFVKRVVKGNSFSDLLKEDQRLILTAEKEIEKS